MGDIIILPDLKIERLGEPLGPIPFLNPREISGGGSSDAFAETAAKIEDFFAEGGRPLAIVSGEHIIGGSVLFHRFITGSPNTSIVYVGLGDGQGAGGGRGEWDSAVAVYYKGALQSVSGGAGAGYRFHAGFISTAVDSGNQQVDAFDAANIAYSGLAYYAIKLTDTDANAGDTPNQLRGRFKGRKFLNFNASGISLGSSYSVNAARFAADRILAYCDHKFPGNATAALAKLQEMVEWDSWTTWRDVNDALISWDNGATTANIKRFECHMAFLDDVTLAEALDQICASSGAHWQLDGRRIVFFPPTERDPVHHFNESNIIEGSVRIEPRDLRQRPNIFEAQFRDTTDTFLGITTTPAIRREALIRQAGKIKASRSLPNMNLSQAVRLLERQARLEADNPVIVAYQCDETSMRVMSGEFVTVSHPLGPWTYQRFLVLEATLQGAEEGPDLCEFVLQKVDDPLYSDTVSHPKQQKLTTLNPTSFTTPDTAQGGTAVTSATNLGHGSTTASANNGATTQKSIKWTTFTLNGEATSIKLKFEWTEDGSVDAGSDNRFRVQYSVNGGSGWTTVFDHLDVITPVSTTTSTTTISTPATISQIQVRDFLEAISVAGESASVNATVSNIRLEIEFA